MVETTNKQITSGLDTPVRFVKGVGPRRAQVLAKLGIETVEDLLNYFPRRHLFSEQLTPINQIEAGGETTVIGRIEDLTSSGPPYRPIVKALVGDDSGVCQVRWFHSGYLLNKLQIGQWIRLFGKVRRYRLVPEFVNPRFEIFDEQQLQAMMSAKSYPVYGAVQEIPTGQIAKLVRQALKDFARFIVEILPPWLLQAHGWMGRREAYQAMHHPQDQSRWEAARQRLAYDELLLMQLAIALRRRRHAVGAAAPVLRCSQKLDQRIRRRLPFKLTAAQQRAVGQIVADLARPVPMNRLLQGDVGSGKTAVAIYAALVAVGNKAQAAIMAPTEILAQQHHRNVTAYLAGSKVRCELLTGSMSKAARAEILQAVAEGRVDILIGTQALLQQDVRFRRLALVIVDEQHKFGVRQRARMQSKGHRPHYLVMTATPIPRSLALTVFGDLDVSVIDEMPPGRRPVRTSLYDESDRRRAYQFVCRQLQNGNQGYIVYPLLDPSDKLQLKAARQQVEQLAARELAQFRVGLIHGQMKSAEKDQVMQRFRSGELDVLVATVVIEVGIDVPTANLLVVEHAERFGLAQLHQLRGRVGRAGKQGYCVLIGSARTLPAKRRLEVLVKTNDGFRIAEEDLRLRGPGEFFGTVQHGLPELKVADLLEDWDLLTQAREDAQRILDRDVQLVRGEHRALRAAMLKQYAGRFELIEAT